MWWVKDHPDHSRGGFQNRDVGKSSFDNDMGPWCGIDYARFSDPPNLREDAKLKENLQRQLENKFPDEISSFEIVVRNGFVILKGTVSQESKRGEIIHSTFLEDGVKEVINQLVVVNSL